MNIGALTATLGVDTSNFDSGIRRSTSSLLNFKTAIAALGLASLGALAYKLNQAAKEWEGLYKKQEQAEAGLKQVMRSMGRYSDDAYSNMLDIAKMMQRTTTFGDEAVISGTRMLMTYKDISDDLMPRVIQAMTDLSALTGRDMVASANLMGRAAMGLTGELRRVGITVDNATYQSQGFLGILKQIESQVHGQARALAQTKSGGMEQYLNIVGDLKERLGELSLDIKMQFVPVLRDIVIQVSDWMDRQRELQELGVPNFFDEVASSAGKAAESLKKFTSFISSDEFKRFLGYWELIVGAKAGAMVGGQLGAIIGAGAGGWYSFIKDIKDPSTKAAIMDLLVLLGYEPEKKPGRKPWQIIEIHGGPSVEGGAPGTGGGGLGAASGLDYYAYMASKGKEFHAEMLDDNRDFWKQMSEGVKSFDTTFSSMFADMLWGADTTFGDILKSFGMMLTQMTIQYRIAQPMFAWLSGLFGGGPPPVGVFQGEGYMPGYAWAKGGAFDNGRILEFARGGLVNRPTLFPMANGAGLMGEAGPEAILPLKRTAGGELGVRAQGGGDTYYITNHIATYDMANFAEYFSKFADSYPGAITGPLQKARLKGRRV